MENAIFAVMLLCGFVQTLEKPEKLGPKTEEQNVEHVTLELPTFNDSAKITEDGEFLLTRQYYLVPLIVNAATTVSFELDVDGHTMHIRDSANGLGGLAAEVGKQIEVSGAVNGNNNFYWKLVSYIDPGHIAVTIRTTPGDPTYSFWGVTEPAGAPVSISVLHTNIGMESVGRIEITGDVTTFAKVKSAPVRQYKHRTEVHITAEIDRPVLRGQAITLSAAAGAAWKMRGGEQNSAFSFTDVDNRSARLIAEMPFGYDNCYHTQGNPEIAPETVGAALDPATLGSLVEWWAPDLETGYADGSAIRSLVGRKGAFNVSSASGFAQRYDANVVGGKAMCFLNATPGVNDGGKRAFVSSRIPNWGVGPQTIIGVFRRQLNAAGRPFDNFLTHAAYNNDINKGVSVLTMRQDVIGNGDLTVDYLKYSQNRRTQAEKINSAAAALKVDQQQSVGRVYLFNDVLSDDEIYRITKWLLAFYSSPWAPTFHVSATGSDSNPGSESLPMKTIGAALTKAIDGVPSHIVVPEGEKIDDPALYRPKNGRSARQPIVIRAKRTTSKEPVFFLRGYNRIFINGFYGNLYVYGCVAIEEAKIPPSSPLRLPEHAAHNPSVATQPMIKCVSSATDPATIYNSEFKQSANMCFHNCHAVGMMMLNVIHADYEIGLRYYLSMIGCSAVHNYGGGHSVTSFTSTAGMIYMADMVIPTGGHEPLDDLEAADIFSRSIYDPYNGPGIRCLKRLFAPFDGSSVVQLRNGGSLLDAVTPDTSAGIIANSADVCIEGLILSGGYRDKSSQSLNQGISAEMFQSARFNRNLFLPENTRNNSAFCYKFHNNPDIVRDDIAKGKPARAWMPLSRGGNHARISNNTAVGRAGELVISRKTSNVTVDSCLVKDMPTVFTWREPVADISAMNYKLLNTVVDSPDKFALADETRYKSLTLSALRTSVPTTGTTESKITYVDETRSPKKYAQFFMNSPTAEAEHLGYELIRQRLLGEVDRRLRVESIHGWVMSGFEPTSHPRDSNGMFLGAFQSFAPTIVTVDSGGASITIKSTLLGGRAWNTPKSGYDHVVDMLVAKGGPSERVIRFAVSNATAATVTTTTTLNDTASVQGVCLSDSIEDGESWEVQYVGRGLIGSRLGDFLQSDPVFNSIPVRLRP